MNVQHIVSEIEKLDPEVYERLDSRRSAMKRFAFAGKVLAAAAIPTALGTMFKKSLRAVVVCDRGRIEFCTDPRIPRIRILQTGSEFYRRRYRISR